MAPTRFQIRTAVYGQGIGGGEVAKFIVSQLVKVVDQSNSHHDLVGSVILVAPEDEAFFYWLRFDPNPDGGRFGEEQLEATA
jgi:hypothetical protein